MCQRKGVEHVWKACAMQISVQEFVFPLLLSASANSELYITLNSYEFMKR